jgi:hypothetical protein
MNGQDSLVCWEQEYPLQEVFSEEVQNGDLVVDGRCPRCEGTTTWPFRNGWMGDVGGVDSLRVFAPSVSALMQFGGVN